MTEDELIFHDLLMATHTVEAVEKARKEVIDKAVKWFRNQKEEIGISWFDDFEFRFRKAMEE